MPSINVSLKDNAPPEELEKAKKSVTSQGGKITREFKLIKGFTYASPHLAINALLPEPFRKLISKYYCRAEFPADKVHTLESNEHMDVEENKDVHTQ